MCTGGYYFLGAPNELASPKKQFEKIVNSSEDFITSVVLGAIYDSYNLNGELDEGTRKDVLEIDVPFEEVKYKLDITFGDIGYNSPEYMKEYHGLRNFMYESIKLFMR